MRRLDDDDSSDMRPMQIVSSDSPSDTCASGLMRNRLVVFVSGVLVALAGVVVAMVFGSVSAAAPDSTGSGYLPPREWTVEVQLNEDDVYKLHVADEGTVTRDIDIVGVGDLLDATSNPKRRWRVRRSKNNDNQQPGDDVDYDDETPIDESDSAGTSHIDTTYLITKMCGNDRWAYMRFEIDDLNVTQPENQLLGQGSANLPSGSLEQVLSSTLQRHTFTTKLGYNGEVLRRDSSNIQQAMFSTFTAYAREYWASLAAYMDQLPLTEEQLQAEERKLQIALMEIGLNTVHNVEEQAYPFLQASPRNDQRISVGDSWERLYDDEGLKFNVTYTLVRTFSDHEPLVINATTIDTETCKKTAPRCGNSYHDKEWLLVVLTANTTFVHDQLKHLVDQLVPSMPGEGLNTWVRFEDVRMDVALRGLMIVGAQSGVVLHGATHVNSRSNILANVTSLLYNYVTFLNDTDDWVDNDFSNDPDGFSSDDTMDEPKRRLKQHRVRAQGLATHTPGVVRNVISHVRNELAQQRLRHVAKLRKQVLRQLNTTDLDRGDFVPLGNFTEQLRVRIHSQQDSHAEGIIRHQTHQDPS